ncbi:hypothetical protein SISSUDRAFT_1068265, partial [Sistotremastrum suecicum HHB10207 ss-3]
MRNLIGIKWWAVKTGPPMKAPDEKKKQDVVEISDDEVPNFSEWEIFVLFPGDGIAISPGSIHAVYSVQPTIFEGWFFYPFTSYKATLYAVVQEHKAGLKITNTCHPPLFANFFRLWVYYYRIWNKHGVAMFEMEGMPDRDNFLDLVAICRHMNRLTPQLQQDPEEPTYLWPMGFVQDRATVKIQVSHWLGIIKKGKKKGDPVLTKLRNDWKKRKQILKDSVTDKPKKHRQVDLWDAGRLE